MFPLPAWATSHNLYSSLELLLIDDVSEVSPLGIYWAKAGEFELKIKTVKLKVATE